MTEILKIKISFLAATFPYRIDKLEHATSINSEFDGNPPLWVTRRQYGKHEEVYINNAKILADQSNIELSTKTGITDSKKQVMFKFIRHIISK